MLTNLFYTINFSFAIFVSIIALVFAFLTIIIVAINRQYRTITNLFACNTAIAVIFYCIVNIFSCIYGLQDDESYNQPACIFRGYCYTASCTAIYYSYLIHAISRLFFAVFYNHRSLLAWRVHWLMIIINWFICITSPIVPILVYGGYRLEQESHLCIATTKIFITSMYCITTAYLIPFSSIIVIYGSILYHANRSTRRVTPFAPSTITPVTTNNIPRLNMKREIQLMKNMLIFTGILACAGTPYLILVFWYVIAQQSSPPEPLYLLSINSVSFSITLMTVNLFWVNRDMKSCTLRYLRKLY